MSDHFPTFKRIGDVTRITSDGRAWWLPRSERGYLRLLLYMALFHALACHVVLLFAEMSGGYVTYFGQPGRFVEPSGAAFYARIVFLAYGQPPYPGFVAVVCLIALVFSSRSAARSARRSPGSDPATTGPAHATAVPEAPARHPLDPDPDDPPIPSWNKRSS